MLTCTGASVSVEDNGKELVVYPSGGSGPSFSIRQFTFHANQIHILGLIMSTEGSLYMGAMVKHIGILQTALTARVDML